MVLGLMLEKFTISWTIPSKDELVATYNPATLSFSYGAGWMTKKQRTANVPEYKFVHTYPTTLSVNLLFNTYNTAIDSVNMSNPLAVLDQTEKDVSKAYIDKLVALSRIQGTSHSPPICSLRWGNLKWEKEAEFQCILSNIGVRYTMFLFDGTPVRAEASCTFKQWREKEIDRKMINPKSPDVYKVHVVQRGDTLSMISHKYYNSPTYWRFIAKENEIVNPLKLEPGTQLIIPTLAPGDR